MVLHVPIAEPESELADIAVQMLRAGVMIDAMKAALHDRPHALDGVRVNAVADVFARAVVDALMGVEQPIEPEVAAMLVGMERRARLDVAVNGAVERVGGRVRDHTGLRPTALLAHPQQR